MIRTFLVKTFSNNVFIYGSPFIYASLLLGRYIGLPSTKNLF
jgi:hypothetical protein